MKKATYLRKYETTLLTDDKKGKQKEAKKTASQLKQFLKEAALDHLKTVEGIDLQEEAKQDNRDLAIKLDEKPHGTITFQLTRTSSTSKGQTVLIYHVQKDRLFKQ